MKLLRAAALVIGLVAPASAVEYTTNYYQIKYSTVAGTATENLSGYFKIAASSKTPTTFKIILDGVLGQGNFFGIGASTFSVNTSSGISIGGTGGLYAAFVKATTIIGNLIGNVTGNLVGNVTGNVTGNSDTATALAATPSAASSTKLCRGIDASGNCLEAATDNTTAGVSASTKPWTSGAGFAHNTSAAAHASGIAGNAATATASDHAPTACGAGSYARGVDSSWNAANCTAVTGDVGTASSQTLSGYNQFTSSISIGVQQFSNASGSIQSSTISYNAVVKGGWATVAYSSFVAASRVEFYNFNSSYTHRATLVYQQVTSAADLYIRFQDDSNARYAWNAAGFENNVAFSNSGAGSTTQIELTLTTILAATGVFGQVYIACPGISQPTCKVQSQLSYTNSAGTAGNSPSNMTASGDYQKAAALVDRFHFVPTAGTMTGYIIIEAFVPYVAVPF